MKSPEEIQNYIEIMKAKKVRVNKKKMDYEKEFMPQTGSLDTSSYDKVLSNHQSVIDALKWVLS